MTTWSPADMVYVRLLWGVEHAQTIGSLADLTGLSRRQVEQALQELAVSGSFPIVAGPRGVYLETNPQAVEFYAKSLQRRLVQQTKRIRALLRCARAMRQPRTLWDDVA